MRMLLRVQMEVEAGNSAIKDGSFGEILDGVMQRIKPEAAYFTAIDGKRTGLIFFDLKEASDIPAIAEPFFHGVNAAIDLFPKRPRRRSEHNQNSPQPDQCHRPAAWRPELGAGDGGPGGQARGHEIAGVERHARPSVLLACVC